MDIAVQVWTADDQCEPNLSSTKLAQIVYELCAFSIDATSEYGVDGTWYRLNPIQSDGQHSGDAPFHLPGTYNFVADMCDHFSTFFSTDSIKFKVVFRIGDQDAAGNFVPTCTTQEILG